VVVTATNTAGNAAATSQPTATITAPTPPVNTVLPTISGSAVQGSVLTATTGTWTGTAPISYTYQWQNCPSGGGACTPITGATTSSYTPTAADVTATLKVVVTASNTAGNAAATSAPTAAVTAPVTPPPATAIGATNPGATFAAPGAGYKFGSIFTATSSGTSIDFRAYVAGGTSAERFTPAVYSVTGGNPAQLLATGKEFIVGAGQTAGWVTTTLTGLNLTAGTSYTLVLVAGTTSNAAHIYYDNLTNAGIWNSNTYPTPTNTWGTINREARNWSFAIDYTPR
jgi:hypothetical protein